MQRGNKQETEEEFKRRSSGNNARNNKIKLSGIKTEGLVSTGRCTRQREKKEKQTPFSWTTCINTHSPVDFGTCQKARCPRADPFRTRRLPVGTPSTPCRPHRPQWMQIVGWYMEGGIWARAATIVRLLPLEGAPARGCRPPRCSESRKTSCRKTRKSGPEEGCHELRPRGKYRQGTSQGVLQDAETSSIESRFAEGLRLPHSLSTSLLRTLSLRFQPVCTL